MINEDNLQNSPKASLNQRNPPAPLGYGSVEIPTTTTTTTSSVKENLYKEGVLDPVYHAKTLVLNRALQEIGMGKYQVNDDCDYIGLFFHETLCLLVYAPFGGWHGMVCVSHHDHVNVKVGRRAKCCADLRFEYHHRDSVWPVSFFFLSYIVLYYFDPDSPKLVDHRPYSCSRHR